ncbi:hypothetical protein T484DRAFT_1961940 [Baffinella frigidus]|nr:hypothetical protein T484DRAFT_1961940 [Cryptophyta sp. CCMP2293]
MQPWGRARGGLQVWGAGTSALCCFLVLNFWTATGTHEVPAPPAVAGCGGRTGGHHPPAGLRSLEEVALNCALGLGCLARLRAPGGGFVSAEAPVDGGRAPDELGRLCVRSDEADKAAVFWLHSPSDAAGNSGAAGNGTRCRLRDLQGQALPKHSAGFVLALSKLAGGEKGASEISVVLDAHPYPLVGGFGAVKLGCGGAGRMLRLSEDDDASLGGGERATAFEIQILVASMATGNLSRRLTFGCDASSDGGWISLWEAGVVALHALGIPLWALPPKDDGEAGNSDGGFSRGVRAALEMLAAPSASSSSSSSSSSREAGSAVEGHPAGGGGVVATDSGRFVALGRDGAVEEQGKTGLFGVFGRAPRVAVMVEAGVLEQRLREVRPRVVVP